MVISIFLECCKHVFFLPPERRAPITPSLCNKVYETVFLVTLLFSNDCLKKYSDPVYQVLIFTE